MPFCMLVDIHLVQKSFTGSNCTFFPILLYLQINCRKKRCLGDCPGTADNPL